MTLLASGGATCGGEGGADMVHPNDQGHGLTAFFITMYLDPPPNRHPLCILVVRTPRCGIIRHFQESRR